MIGDKIPTTIRLPAEVYEKLRFLAYAERRSINGMVEHAIKAYIRQYEERSGPIVVPEPQEE